MVSQKKIVLITGANSGIGFELTRLIAKEGHKVWLGSRNPQAGEEAAKKLNSEGLSNVKSVQLDVTKKDTIIAAKNTIEKEDGKLNVLVNNAGIGAMARDQNALTVGFEVIQECMDTNFYGRISTSQTFVPLLRAAAKADGYAAIADVASDMASNTFQARPGSILHVVAYNTSKAAANSYSIALSKELAKDNIKVNVITPGFTMTKLNNFHAGGKTMDQGAQTIVPWALIDKDGPTGTFHNEKGEVMPW